MAIRRQGNLSPDFALRLFLDRMSALKLESELEQKRKKAMKEENIEMESEIWSKLPEELLMVVLASLPTFISRGFRSVCKAWHCLLLPAPTFRQVSSTLLPSCCPAFLVVGNSFLDHLYLLLPSRVHPLSLDFMGAEGGNVLTACKSIFCYVKADSFYICNPITRTFITLPPRPSRLAQCEFYGLAFDSSMRTCIFVIGNNTHINGPNNNMVMEIYDSSSNAWTKSEISAPISILLRGEGLYSRGRFYWINNTLGEASDMFAFHVVAFDVAERHWRVIRLPQRPDGRHPGNFYYWKLTGYEGNVVLVDNSDLSLWKLNEDYEKEESCRWSELQAFPRNLHEENLRQGNSTSPAIFSSYDHPQVIVNSCGWVLIHIHGYKMVVFDAVGRLIRSIEGKLLKVLEQNAMPIPLHAYEINNVWWP